MSLSIPALTEFTGNLGINRGGTNSTTSLVGSSIIVSNGTQLIQGELGTSTTLLHGNEFGEPFYAAVNLSDDVESVLGVQHGGTNNWAIPTAGQILVGNFGTYTCANIAAGPNITVTNSNGGIEISATGGSPAGATANIQYNDAGAFAASTTTLIDPADGRLMLGAVQVVPASNAAGVKLFAKAQARDVPSWIGTVGPSVNFQSSFGNNKIAYLTALGASSSSMQGFGASLSEAGAKQIRATAATNKLTQIRKLGYQASTNGAFAVCGIRSVQQAWFRGSSEGLGGFHAVFKWGLSSGTGATTSMIVGMTALTTVYNGSTTPNLMTNLLCFGAVAGDSFGFYHNDHAGNASSIVFGADFPVNITDFYEGHIYCAPNSTDVSYYCKNLVNDAEVSGVVSADLPAGNQLLAFRVETSNGNTAYIPGIDISSIYVETPY